MELGLFIRPDRPANRYIGSRGPQHLLPATPSHLPIDPGDLQSRSDGELRNRIERFFNRIKHFRRLATRYEKHAANFLAMIKLAATHLWLRHNESVCLNHSSLLPRFH